MDKSGGKYTGDGSKADLDNHGNQGNPNHGEHKGYSGKYGGDGSKSDRDNHGQQLNPNSDKYQGKK